MSLFSGFIQHQTADLVADFQEEIVAAKVEEVKLVDVLKKLDPAAVSILFAQLSNGAITAQESAVVLSAVKTLYNLVVGVFVKLKGKK